MYMLRFSLCSSRCSSGTIMSSSTGFLVIAAALLCNAATAAMMGERELATPSHVTTPVQLAPPEPPGVVQKDPLHNIQGAAKAAMEAAAKQGIISSCGCTSGAAELEAAAVKAEQMMASNAISETAAEDDTEVETLINCSIENTRTVTPVPTALAQKAKAAGEKAQKLANECMEADLDARKSVEVTKVLKAKAEMMKSVVAKAFAKATAQAAANAKAKLGMASVIPTLPTPEHQKTDDSELTKAEEAEDSAIKKQRELMEEINNQPKKKNCRQAVQASEDLECEQNKFLHSIDANFAHLSAPMSS